MFTQHDFIPGHESSEEANLLSHRAVYRPAVDSNSLLVDYLENGIYYNRNKEGFLFNGNKPLDILKIGLPFESNKYRSDLVCTQQARVSLRARAPCVSIEWYPGGRRLIVGTVGGELTLWNGTYFSFEDLKSVPSGQGAVLALNFSKQDDFIACGDGSGNIVLLTPALAPIASFRQFLGHVVRDVTISPTGNKVVAAAENVHPIIIDVGSQKIENSLVSRGYDITCSQWHPIQALIATGSQTYQLHLWDPRTANAIGTIFGHKHSVVRIKWNSTGQMLASSGKDGALKIWDIRSLNKPITIYKTRCDAVSISWHPEIESFMTVGFFDGDICYYNTNVCCSQPLGVIPNAHQGAVWGVAWHPLGHLVASSGQDSRLKIWSRSLCSNPGTLNSNEILPQVILPRNNSGSIIRND
ncbi:polyadenylation factor subunit 2 [Cryptosporidium andersoni]|uniref:Polyadenylation factor subunit 2 n=1 Tax=Cryptosporidium andersoni TaxID=117008 RepID=A0A1J4ME79_9CRYT|nr:polyadenylation factor subunit 2 [Cryptosporidium andersoni]